MKRPCTLLVLVAVVVSIASLSGSSRLTGKADAAATAWAYIQLRVGGIGGAVTANPPGTLVDPECPNGICVFAYPEGTRVSLVPVSAPGSSFRGWKKLGSLPGRCYYLGDTCSTTATGTEGLMAAFSPVQLSVGANAGGSVDILTSGNSCGNGCAFYPYGSSAVIEARNEDGYSFDGWYGGCQGIGPKCRVSLFDNRSISATFGCHLNVCKTQGPYTGDIAITVVTHGRGSALVRGSLCRNQCTKSAPKLGMVTIEAKPDPGASATGWRTTTVRCSYSGTRCSFPAFNDARGNGPRIDVYFN